MKIPKTELMKLSDIRPDKSNPNMMSDKKFAALKEVISKYGFIVPVVVNKDNVICDGFHRWKAARELNLGEISVIKLDVNEVDRKILRQVLNKLRGEHDVGLDALEFKFILEESSMEDFTKLSAISEQEVMNVLNAAVKEEVVVPKVDEVDYLGKLQVTCPKCGHTFKKGDSK